jgi:hypothetical protein
MIQRDEIDHSAGARSLYVYRFGNGRTRVLLWSQMHGNGSTGTMALADLARYLQESNASRIQEWASRLTIAFVPMANPDGAERSPRDNGQGKDVGRDATSETDALRSFYDSFRPHFALHLQDQNSRTRVGESDRLAAISLRAPPKTASHSDEEQLLDARRIAATLRRAMGPFVGGYITRYDDSSPSRDFGNSTHSWATRSVDIGSGVWQNDQEKQYLRSVNFIALLNVLDAIADESYKQMPLMLYESLPPVGRTVTGLLIRGGLITLPGREPSRSDITADFQENARPYAAPNITDMGDLLDVDARDTIDVRGRFLHPAVGTYRETPARQPYVPLGAPAEFVVSASRHLSDGAIGFIQQGRYRSAAPTDLVPAEPRPALAACYQVELGEWPEHARKSGGSTEPDWTRPPQRVELLWRYAPDHSTSRSFIVKPLAPSAPFRTQIWRRLSTDSVAITWSSVAGGIALQLVREADDLRGTARLFFDGGDGRGDPATTATLKRLPCTTN